MTLKQLLTFCAVGMLCGCATASVSARYDVAVKIGRSAGMTERVIQAGPFSLTTWERMTQPGLPVNVYIEGDGRAWLNRRTKSPNPTPPNPLALQLAAADPAPNIIYMARPCQYTGWSGGGPCPDRYWTGGRTAPEVIEAYQQALDNIKSAHGISGFNLTGYSGGAAVALLVAAARTDVLSLRTVAGNTDYATFSALHNVSPVSESLNPLDVAEKIARIPQLHLIGGEDTIVTSALFNSWQQASGKTGCVRSIHIPGATHEKGWVERWPELLKTPLTCSAAR